MNRGKYIFAEMFQFISHYDYLNVSINLRADIKPGISVDIYYFFLVFRKLTLLWNLSYTILYPLANKTKLFYLDIGQAVSKAALNKASENRGWRKYQDFALMLIECAKMIYKEDSQLKIDVKNNIFIID